MSADLFMHREADFVSDGAAGRLRLGRVWDERLPRAAWLMCNPSIADANLDDNTTKRCIHFARKMGCGSLDIVNLWPCVATDPADLWRLLEASYPELREHLLENMQAIEKVVSRASIRFVAMGAEPVKRFPHYVRHMLRLFTAGEPAWCLGITDEGWPLHPLARGKKAIPNDRAPSLWMVPGLDEHLTADRNCGGCRHFSQWLDRAGDCMEFASARQSAIIEMARNLRERQFPALHAPVVMMSGLCDRWEDRRAS